LSVAWRSHDYAWKGVHVQRSSSDIFGPDGEERETSRGRSNVLATSPNPVIPRRGTPIDEYEVERVLGIGGMGVVLSARDTKLERRVALKLVHPELLQLPGVEESFLEEARAMAALSHPNVVAIHSFGQYRGAPYFSMDLVEGVDLERRLYASLEPPLSLSERIDILEQVACALDAIHVTGRIHGDVKAENVLLGRGGRVRISDMGLTEALGRLARQDVRGTPAYMPPERAANHHLHQALIPRQDVYSFAVLAFELITGRLPFVLEDHEPVEKLLAAHIQRPPPRPSAVSPNVAEAFDAPILRSLNKAPECRHGSAGELAEELRRIADSVTSKGEMRVLVADDDVEMRRMVADALAKQLPGVVVETASDGRAALSRIRSRTPDVLITDLEMPGLNGLELTAALRELDNRVGIIVITGFGSANDWRVLNELGADHFFVKPANLDLLCNAVDQLTSAG
jgi:serine/threonine-protein kinase